jgi:hypothetical protein
MLCILAGARLPMDSAAEKWARIVSVQLGGCGTCSEHAVAGNISHHEKAPSFVQFWKWAHSEIGGS